MQEKRLYVNPDLKIADLASVLNVSPYTLSYVFNQFLNKNYYDYLNDYRIAEFKRLLNEDEYSKYTLSALAELCGFSSRTSFFRYFKKTTGITPNEYVQSIGRTNEDWLPESHIIIWDSGLWLSNWLIISRYRGFCFPSNRMKSIRPFLLFLFRIYHLYLPA